MVHMTEYTIEEYAPDEFTDDIICSRIGDTITGLVDGEVLSFTKIHEEPLEKKRWSTTTQVVTRDPEGRFWAFTYEDPATESQSRDDWDIATPSQYVEVEPRTKTIEYYVKKES